MYLKLIRRTHIRRNYNKKQMNSKKTDMNTIINIINNNPDVYMSLGA